MVDKTNGGARWRLEGRRVLITGGTKGIGAAIAAELLELGATVTVTARGEAEIGARLADWKAYGYSAYGIPADMTLPEDRWRAMDYALEAMGGLDILVNNAGTNRRGPSLEITPQDYALVMETNVTAPWEMCRIAHPHLKAASIQTGDACIVGIGSVAGSKYIGSGAPYAMSKAAMDELTKYLAVEWAADGIRVNGVNPWYTKTPLANRVLDDPQFTERVLARTPIKRIADPADIAGMVAFLCLPVARHITGQNVAVDGGYLANGAF
ncbi:MAG: SDR family oxidoreductase [Armatimonadaceae bacterium]